MNKKQRCLFKRFAALVAALMLCASLCVPCFASNNASTKKWYVAAEDSFITESGVNGRYLKLTPYVNGQEFTYTSLSYSGSASLLVTDPSNNIPTRSYTWVMPVNYPDWWRSSLPLGNRTYIDFRLVSASYSPIINGVYSNYTGQVDTFFFDSANAFDVAYDIKYSGSSEIREQLTNITLSGSPHFYITSAPSTNSGSTVGASSLTLSPSSTFTRLAVSDFVNIVPVLSVSKSSTNSPVFGPTNLSNLSSDRFVIALVGNSISQQYWKCQFKMSFWVDATKLPAGLKVGDEFPANDDAFDQLRDELIKQFPEAAENVENGKDTINGWNDTETVGSDVAESSLSVINGLFQNLGQFLAIVSLMIFGAVCLRMLIKKAVSG